MRNARNLLGRSPKPEAMTQAHIRSRSLVRALRREMRRLRAEAGRIDRETRGRRGNELRFQQMLAAQALREAAHLLEWYTGRAVAPPVPLPTR